MIGIYKITSPTKRSYIGKTIDITSRWSNYRLLNCKGQPKIYNSLRKYGYINHTFEILEICLEQELETRELYWINQLDTINTGLNCCPGPAVDRKINQDATKKYGNTSKKYKFIPDFKGALYIVTPDLKQKVWFSDSCTLTAKEKQSIARKEIAKLQSNNTQQKISDTIEVLKMRPGKITQTIVAIEMGMGKKTVIRYWNEFKGYVKEINDEKKLNIKDVDIQQ